MKSQAALEMDREHAGERRAPSPFVRLAFAPSLPDLVVLGYIASVIVGLGLAPSSPERNFWLVFVIGVWGAYLAMVWFVRLFLDERIQRPGAVFALRSIYRLAPVATFFLIYINLRPILPIINPGNWDEELYRLDLRLFTVEPSMWIEQYSTRGVVEWFSFFYYSYFFFIASFIFCMIFSSRNDMRLASFATGALLVFGTGQFIYTLVPGLGPYAHLAHEYAGPIQGGTFFQLIVNAVDAAGPLRDIFPSIHTAMPVFLSLFMWRHYRWIAPVTTFFTLNIMVATVMLRWHYLIDVIAGVSLAVFAFWLAPRLVEGYQSRRTAVGVGDLRRW